MEGQVKKTLIALLALVGCEAQTPRCPNAPKAVAKISVGTKVAWTVSQEGIGIKKGDTGTVISIEYIGKIVMYWVASDKDLSEDGMPVVRPAFQRDDWIEIEAVGKSALQQFDIPYPDGALRNP